MDRSEPSADRWATFDCYGTLIDWNGGLVTELGRIFGESEGPRMLTRYHELEPLVQEQDPSLSYRDVMASVLARLARDEGIDLPGARALRRWLYPWRDRETAPERGERWRRSRRRKRSGARS